MTSAGVKPNTRYGAIDSLRGTAALSVFLFHLNECALPFPSALLEGWRSVWRHGHLGVPLFFVISGFCIGRSWLQSGSANGFLIRRFRRIFPPYWASLALIGAAALLFKLFRGVNDFAPLPMSPDALALTLILATKPVTEVPVANWVYWSLSFEVAFYLVLTATLFARRFWGVWPLVILHGSLSLTATLPAANLTGPLFFVELWPLFGTGVAAAIHREHKAAALIMAGFSAIHFAVCAFDGRLIAYWLTTSAGALICLRAADVPEPGRIAPLGYAGKISYSIYLIHVPIGVGLIQRALPSMGESGAVEIGRQLLVVGLTLVAAEIFYRKAERPFLN